MNSYLHKEYEELKMLQMLSSQKKQKDISHELGIAIGKVNYLAKALIDKGFLKAGNFINEKDKTKYKYLLTEEGLKQKVSLTKKFIKIKKAEYEELQRELELDRQKWGSV
jgi:EPS-associated MarR family transcriptional regulator